MEQNDQRDKLWEVVWETWYDVSYEELAARALADSWMRFDAVARLAVALTASGSAVTGWAVWGQQGYKTAWTILAGVAAILAIVHSTLGVPSTVKKWSKLCACFERLRVEVETLQQKMRIDAEFSLDDFRKHFETYRDRYAVAIEEREADLLRTKRFRRTIQLQLNERLGINQ